MIVSFCGVNYECAKALKGSNYVHLLDTNGKIIAAFDGVSNFSGFVISGGSWSTPKTENSCFLAVVREDGTVVKSSVSCGDIPKETEEWTFTLEDGSVITKNVVVK